MNKPRRKELQKALELLEQARDIIEVAMEEEQEAYDNLPESIQEGDMGYTMDENISDLMTAVDSIDELTEGINGVIDR